MTESGPRGLRILSLDGGDSRCLSQLCILQEFMYRLEQKTGKKTRPCNYFDIIVGVDAASAIAAFLVVFGMTVEEAQEAFAKMYSDISGDDDSTPTTRAERLETAIKNLMQSEPYKIPLDTKLSGVSLGGQCKLAICYTPAVSMGHCSMFRNYRASFQASYDPTIIEALRAACATPGWIASAFVGPMGVEEELVSAMNGFNNPTKEVIEEAYKLFGAEHRISCLLSLGSGKRGAISLENTQSNAHPSISAQIASDSENVAEETKKQLGRLKIYYRFSVDVGLEGPRPFRGGFGSIISHTSVYLSKFSVSKSLDNCLKAVEKFGGVTLERLYRTRVKGLGSAHGLPPLSAFFVNRRQPMEAIVNGLLEGDDFSQRVMIISAMGGCGKTQLALKFARDYEDRFQHIFFIDASSLESLQSGLISRVRAIGYEYTPKTPQEALEILARPDDNISTDWLMILDNADDPTIDLSKFMPVCEHGSVLITTRNPMIGDLAPGSHLRLDVMSREEAVEALLATVFPSKMSLSAKSTVQEATATSSPLPTTRDREQAGLIVDQLGYLPIAVVQAGCYIKQQHCLHEYLDRLRVNRARLLERPTRFHRDTLKYDHSVYAAFDITLEVLSSRARNLMCVLSFVHFSNFPRSLFSVAAKSQFKYQPYELLENTPEFDEAAQFLTETLCPDGEWNEEELNDLLQELQQYSLVALVPMFAIVTLRFHPLAHSWARDRMSVKDQGVHRAAAVRLLASGLNQDYYYYFDYLVPHIHAFTPVWDTLHVNDQATFTQILRWEGNSIELVASWERIYQKVEETLGVRNARTARAKLQLADAYGQDGDWARMERMEREVVDTMEELLGHEHLDTVYALANLARTARGKRDFDEAVALEKDVLRIRIKTLGIWHKDTAAAMMDLAYTFRYQARYADEQGLVAGAVDVRTKVLGRSNVQTVQSLQTLAECHYMQRHHQEAENLQREVLRLRQLLYGDHHLVTVRAMEWLAQRYYEQKRYAEAEVLRREELATRRRVQGDRHLETLETLYWTARVCYEQGHYADAERLWREELQGRREVMGNEHIETINVMHWLARACSDQGLHAEAEKLWAEDLKGRRGLLGDSHEQTLNAMGWLAGAKFEQGLYAEAEALRREELTGWRKMHGDVLNGDVCNALHWLARALYSQERFSEAEELWREDMKGRRERLGPKHEQSLNAMGWCAMACYRQDKVEEAEKLRREELEGWREIKGNIHNDTFNAIHWLARAVLDQGRTEEAEVLWREDLSGRTQLLGERNSARLNAMGWLAFACYKGGNHSEAESLRRSEWQGWKDMQGGRDTDSLHAMYWLGEACFDQEKYAEAVKVWEEELEIRREVQGSHHQQVARALGRLGESYHLLDRPHDAKQYIEEAMSIQREIENPDDTGLLERLEELLPTIEKELDNSGPSAEMKSKEQQPLKDKGTKPQASNGETPAPQSTQVASKSMAEESGEQIGPSPDVPAAPEWEIETVEDAPGPDDEEPASLRAQKDRSRSPSPVPRPISPFQQRSLFGRQPNQWSMFF